MSKATLAFSALYVLSIMLAGLVYTEFASIIIFFSLGTAAGVFLLAGNVVIYGASIMASLIARDFGLGRRSCWALAVVGICLTAFGPGLWSSVTTEFTINSLTYGDVAKTTRKNPRHIELVWPRFSPWSNIGNVRSAPCERICQTLLTTSQVDSVTVKTFKQGAESVAVIKYTLEERDFCPPHEFDRKKILPHTVWLDRRGTCLIPQFDVEVPSDTIRVSVLTTDASHSYIPELTPENRMFVRRIEILDRTKPEYAQLRFRDTEVKTSVMKLPFHAVLSSRRFRVSFALPRLAKSTTPVSPDDVLREQLGYKLEVPVIDMDSILETEIALLLDQPRDMPFSSIQAMIVNDYLGTLDGQSEPTEAQIALVGRIIADKRIVNTANAASLMEKRPEFTARLVPEIIQRILHDMQWHGRRDSSAFARSLAQLEPRIIQPHASQLNRIIQEDKRRILPELLTIGGQLKRYPVPALRKGLAVDNEQSEWVALMGICDADMKWKSELLPLLEEYMNDRSWNERNAKRMVPGILALRRFGSNEVAKKLVSALETNSAARFETELGEFRRKHENRACSES